MGLLTVFANFRIDSEERFLRMQDSFRSFCDADIEKWIVNIRGPYKVQAAKFLMDNLGHKIVLFELESERGWFYDTRQMLLEIDSEYIFFWIEDNICVAGVEYFNRVVSEMKKYSAEYLLYTAFHNGATLESFDCLTFNDGNSIITVNYDASRHLKRLEYINNKNLICASFVISACSILSAPLFVKIILKNDPLIKRWPRETPFDFEKNSTDIHWLPIKVAQTKSEFFSFIDDDHGDECHSLISRGLYPNRVSRETMFDVRSQQLSRKSLPLLKRLYCLLITGESKIRYALASRKKRNKK